MSVTFAVPRHGSGEEGEEEDEEEDEEEEADEEAEDEDDDSGQVFIRPVLLADFEDARAKILAQMGGKDDAAWELGPGAGADVDLDGNGNGNGNGDGVEVQEPMTDTH